MLKVRNSGVLLTISMMLISVSVCISVTGKFAYAGNQELRVGAMGDSLTDEYGADDNRSGMVWVEQLVASRDFNFGAFSSVSRGEPPRAGYEYNWARSGATATGDYSYALPRQWAGLANQVIAGEVNFIYLGIGGNDFGFTNDVGKYDLIARGNLSGNALDEFIDRVVGRIETAIDVVSVVGNVQLVLGNITDFGVTPGVQQYYNAAQRDRVTNAIMQANAKIQAIADQRVIPVIDAFNTGNLSLGDSFTIAGVHINPRGSSDDPHDFFLSDDVHPGTVVQGLLANMFIEAINRAYHTNIEPLSDQEILANAGIPTPNTGDDPMYFDISSFVIDPTAPQPDFNGDGIVDAIDMCMMVDHWHIDEPAYDIAPPPYGDGIVDVQDLTILAEHLFEEPPQRPQATTVVIVRHAERSNGTLTEDGEKRAETLARLLSKSGISAIFSTNFTRTIETANNTAERLGIPIQFYTSIQEVADLIKSEYIGKVVLVVGHSNTVTQTIEALGVSSVPQFDGRYDNLYIVTIRPDDIASLTHLKYEIHPDL